MADFHFLWYLVDCNATNTTINQISLLPVHQVSSGGHVMVSFAVCFGWIVEKRPCFVVNDHHGSPVSSSFSSGNVDELIFLMMNWRAMPLGMEWICGFSLSGKYLLRVAQNSIKIVFCRKLTKMLHFWARFLTIALCV